MHPLHEMRLLLQSMLASDKKERLLQLVDSLEVEIITAHESPRSRMVRPDDRD